ncbi:hypothetical protein AZE42_13982, partial [Rhizopogon vesiculosus]
MDAETREKLCLLAQYLKNLPNTIPMVDASATEYGFDFFDTSSNEDTSDMGEVEALNRILEVRFGPRNNGPIIFKERGIGLEAVVDVLQSSLELHARSSEVILLE